MNYRRGLQRLYFVLAVVWIAGVTFVLFSYRWQPWRSTLPAWVIQNETSPTSPDPTATLTPDVFMHERATTEIRHRVWIWTAILSIVLPLLLYGLLFGIAPWVYRGFKPGMQS